MSQMAPLARTAIHRRIRRSASFNEKRGSVSQSSVLIVGIEIGKVNASAGDPSVDGPSDGIRGRHPLAALIRLYMQRQTV